MGINQSTWNLIQKEGELIKPIIYKIKPFDTVNGTTITLSWAGAQQFSNRLIIRNNDTNEQVYEAVYNSFKGIHQIPAGSGLRNGYTYNCTAYVTDSNGVESEPSTPVLFKCLSTPSFYTNINNNQIIENSNLSVQLIYSQPENELIDSWEISLYDTSKSRLYSTGLKYDVEPELMNTILHGLKDRTEYYIKATGTTVNGMELDSGYIHIMVTIETANIFSNLELSNRPDLGSIQVKANIVSIEGWSRNGKAVYYYNDRTKKTYVDVRKDEVIFDDGFNISNDFSLLMRLYDLTINKAFLTLLNDKYGISLTLRTGIFSDTGSQRKWYIELKTINSLVPHVIYSDYFDYNKEFEILAILLERKSGYYNIRVMHSAYLINQYLDLDQFTYGYLSDYTHEQLRNEVLT